MNKTTFFTILAWMVLCIIFIVGQIAGANLFFVLCNDCFAFLNGMALIAMTPALITEAKNLFKKGVEKEIKDEKNN